MDYWGYPNRQNEIKRLLTAVATGDHDIPLILFLPVFARDHLYSYVLPNQFHDGLNRDCHWASFNFFNDPPDNRFAVQGDISAIVASEYIFVKAPTQLGDVILFFDGDKLIHSCAYIADDVVFTKNGVGVGVPFILEKLDNVVAFYQEQCRTISLAFCRRKAATPAENQTVLRK